MGWGWVSEGEGAVYLVMTARSRGKRTTVFISMLVPLKKIL
jgi:hypothetical protein